MLIKFDFSSKKGVLVVKFAFATAILKIDLAHAQTFCTRVRPFLDPVTWYGINYTGTQMTQWDFENKINLTSPARLTFVLEVPLRHLRPSVIYSVPCDQILQRAYCRKISFQVKLFKRDL